MEAFVGSDWGVPWATTIARAPGAPKPSNAARFGPKSNRPHGAVGCGVVEAGATLAQDPRSMSARLSATEHTGSPSPFDRDRGTVRFGGNWLRHQAHHLEPLALGEREATPADFAWLCAFCHEIAYCKDSNEVRSIANLKEKILPRLPNRQTAV
jgi:hypothetical protein